MTADVRTTSGQVRQRRLRVRRHQARPRFLEEPGQLDLVYNIAEGDRYRVGKINIQHQGRVFAHAGKHRAKPPLLQAGRHRRYPTDSRQRSGVETLRACSRAIPPRATLRKSSSIRPTAKATNPEDDEQAATGRETARRPPRSGVGFRGQSPDSRLARSGIGSDARMRAIHRPDATNLRLAPLRHPPTSARATRKEPCRRSAANAAGNVTRRFGAGVRSLRFALARPGSGRASVFASLARAKQQRPRAAILGPG